MIFSMDRTTVSGLNFDPSFFLHFKKGEQSLFFAQIRGPPACILLVVTMHLALSFFFYLASHGVSGSLTSSVYGDGASAADPASIVNQVQFAEIRSPMESTIGIKRIRASSCKSQKENRSPDGPDKEGAEMIQLPFHVLKEIPGNLSE